MSKGSIFLIPSYLSEANDAHFIAPMVLDVIKNTNYYLVEDVRTARRYISSLKLGIDISALHFEILDKKTNYQQMGELMKPLNEGHDVGIISEAGLPGLADPGHLAVAFAHKNDISVVPLPGASSIQTAVVSSGFNGQQFTFNGYLPIKKAERIKAMKDLELEVTKSGFTQVFMETPFRNMGLFQDLLENLSPTVLLHVSSDLFGDKEFVKTKTIADWEKTKVDLHKIPTVFCLGQMS